MESIRDVFILFLLHPTFHVFDIALGFRLSEQGFCSQEVYVNLCQKELAFV